MTITSLSQLEPALNGHPDFDNYFIQHPTNSSFARVSVSREYSDINVINYFKNGEDGPGKIIDLETRNDLLEVLDALF